jgi:hypothetical protein
MYIAACKRIMNSIKKFGVFKLFLIRVRIYPLAGVLGRSSIAHWRSGIFHYLFDKRVSFSLQIENAMESS